MHKWPRPIHKINPPATKKEKATVSFWKILLITPKILGFKKHPKLIPTNKQVDAAVCEAVLLTLATSPNTHGLINPENKPETITHMLDRINESEK